MADAVIIVIVDVLLHVVADVQVVVQQHVLDVLLHA